MPPTTQGNNNFQASVPRPAMFTKKYLRARLGISPTDRRNQLRRAMERDGILEKICQSLEEWRGIRTFTPAQSQVIAAAWGI